MVFSLAVALRVCVQRVCLRYICVHAGVDRPYTQAILVPAGCTHLTLQPDFKVNLPLSCDNSNTSTGAAVATATSAPEPVPVPVPGSGTGPVHFEMAKFNLYGARRERERISERESERVQREVKWRA